MSSTTAALLFACPICLDALVQPVLATCCGQSFCDACLREALTKTDACPLCREPLLSGPHSAARNRALEGLLAHLPASTEHEWRHWCRVHWSSLQCAFYVALFVAFVFFLRVQEEEFAEHQHRRL
ncbi:hypothetical protein PybrP1_012906 [[Pythium] brassicae (nom. inval.)]|nr:hypothetical protein PybrP1_012906 [[Pythium] brassicae (nom. inval.)]